MKLMESKIMITVNEFKKLEAFQSAGYVVRCDGDVVSLFYNKEEGDDWPDEYNCTFTFENDRYGVVCTIDEWPYNKAKWTVEKVEQIKWRNTSAPEPKVSKRSKRVKKK